MGGIAKKGWRGGLRGVLLVALSLLTLLTSVVPVQARPRSPAERLDLVPEGCVIPEHRTGEFLVTYESEEAMLAAPRGHVVEETAVDGPGGGVFEQRLIFEEVKKKPDPEKRRAMEEGKKRKLEGKSGVTHVGYAWDGGGACKGQPDELVLQSRQKLFEYVCSPGGLKGLFGKDGDAQRRLCEDREPDPETCAPRERPGELLVYYASKEDAPAVPKENVVVFEEAVVIRGGPPDSGPPDSGPPEPGEEFFMRHLLFKEIKDQKDPEEQRAAHEAKKRELLEHDERWPGVVNVEGLLETPQGKECIGSGVSRVLLYICGPKGLEKVFGGDVDVQRWLCGPQGGGGNNCYPNCNQGIVEKAKKIIGGDRSDAGGRAGGKDDGKAGGKDAYKAVLEGTRSGGSGKLSASSGSDPGETAAADAKGGSSKAAKETVDGSKGANSEARGKNEKIGSDEESGAVRGDDDREASGGPGSGGPEPGRSEGSGAETDRDVGGAAGSGTSTTGQGTGREGAEGTGASSDGVSAAGNDLSGSVGGNSGVDTDSVGAGSGLLSFLRSVLSGAGDARARATGAAEDGAAPADAEDGTPGPLADAPGETGGVPEEGNAETELVSSTSAGEPPKTGGSLVLGAGALLVAGAFGAHRVLRGGGAARGLLSVLGFLP